jgi:hypothetical protein
MTEQNRKEALAEVGGDAAYTDVFLQAARDWAASQKGAYIPEWQCKLFLDEVEKIRQKWTRRQGYKWTRGRGDK